MRPVAVLVCESCGRESYVTNGETVCRQCPKGKVCGGVLRKVGRKERVG